MAQPPADNNPFGEIEADTLDRVPRPTTAKQAIWVILAFVVMGIGGLVFAAGLAIQALGGGAFGVVPAVIGLGLCSLGYAFYRRSHQRTRRVKSRLARRD